MEKHIIQQGSSTQKPSHGDTVNIHYKASMKHQDPYDSSLDRNTPFTFIVNSGQVISGLDQAVQTMQIGEIATFVIDPRHGYGSKGKLSLIPPNTTLYFEISLLNIEESMTSPDYLYRTSLKKKLLGNNYFKSGSYYNAISCYEQALDLIKQIKGTSPGKKEQMIALYSNISTCHYKLDEFDQSFQNSMEAFNLDPHHIKTCHRIGQIYLMKGEYSLGVRYVHYGLAKSPENTELLDLLHKLEEKQKAYLQSRKKAYSGLFQP
ncbi:hypothetical protein BDB01DRAFT_770232 [Pilobolus umbonatus]|nr:hypothetical protein BDB01DRAFT_770232 [Pilobolus umbonatus]